MDTKLTDDALMTAITGVCEFESAAAEKWRTEALLIGRAVERAVLAALPSDAPGAPNVEPTPLDDETVAVIRSFVDRPGETYRGVITRRLGIGFGRALRRAIEESRAAAVASAAVAPNAAIDLQQVAALETAICNGQSSEALRLLHHVRNALAAPTPTVAPSKATVQDGAENFACYLIDNCENEVIREESVQAWLGKMLANPRYAHTTVAADAAAPSEDAYVAQRLTEVLAEVWATIMGDDAQPEDESLNAIERVKKAAQVLRLEVDLYRAQREEAAAQPDERAAFTEFRAALSRLDGSSVSLADRVMILSNATFLMDEYARASAPQAALTDEQCATVTEAANVIAILTGHDSFANLKHKFGDDPWTSVNKIASDLRALLATAPTERMSDAARDVLAERARHVSVEGWTPEHDDEHDSGELADAAAAYALHASGWTESMPREVWPADWSQTWWKPTTPRRDLVKATSLLIAEIERIDRAARKAEIERSGSAGGEA
ncbi:hypothetical protein EHZ19_28285 [Paraburkholderia bannensis]|nr:hypothetical protein [Paraburkholderia bannensis]RQM44550.1 hypothetical protein EHZ19_28285 [Paraburkholderia bannensis]